MGENVEDGIPDSEYVVTRRGQIWSVLLGGIRVGRRSPAGGAATRSTDRISIWCVGWSGIASARTASGAAASELGP